MKTDEHECPKNLATIRAGVVISGCELCLTARKLQGGGANYERNWQRREYRRDIIQPNQPNEFVRAQGADKARAAGYSEAQIRKYS